MSVKKILVIRLSALGDIIQSFPAFQAIREHHPEAHITVMTTSPYTALLKKSGLFDEVWEHRRIKFHKIGEIFAFRKQFLSFGFDRVYDLQLSQRSSFYYYLIGGKMSGAQWVGKARGGTVQFCEPRSLTVNTLDRHQALLAFFGMRLEKADLRYLATPLPISLPASYVVIVPGASNSFQGAKKWPQEHYAELCRYLIAQQITPVVIGGPDEDNSKLRALCPEVIDLTGQTSLTDVIALSKDARLVVGNDTGPMHLAIASLVPVLILFSGKTDAQKVLIRDVQIQHLQADNIADLSPGSVIQKVKELLAA